MKRTARLMGGVMAAALVAVFLNLAGCQMLSRGVGETVAPEKRRPLEEGGPHEGMWKAPDLVFSYQYNRQGNQMTVKGTVDFTGAVASFPIMRRFYIDAYYLNAAGQVIAVNRIFNGFNGSEIDTWQFTRTVDVPPEAAGWAIGYSGTAQEYGYPSDGANWTFWDTPFK